MTLADFFARFWWLIFPIFGMAWAFAEMVMNQRRARSAMDLIRSYVDQGKEPPPELLRQATAPEPGEASTSDSGDAWSFIVFAALGVAAGLGYYFMQAEDWAVWLLVGAAFAGVMSLGALGILLFRRKR